MWRFVPRVIKVKKRKKSKAELEFSTEKVVDTYNEYVGILGKAHPHTKKIADQLRRLKVDGFY